MSKTWHPVQGDMFGYAVPGHLGTISMGISLALADQDGHLDLREFKHPRAVYRLAWTMERISKE